MMNPVVATKTRVLELTEKLRVSSIGKWVSGGSIFGIQIGPINVAGTR